MDSSLAIALVVSTGSLGGDLTERPDVNLSNRIITFDGAFISSPANASFGGQEAQINVSLGGANAQGNGELLYFCFPHFGDDRLYYDPTFGLLQISNFTPPETSTTTGTTPSTRLVDTTRILLISVGVTTLFVLVLVIRSKKR